MMSRETAHAPHMLFSLFAAVASLPALVQGADAAQETNFVHPEDMEVLQKIRDHEKLDAPPEFSPLKGWPSMEGRKAARFRGAENPKHVLAAALDESGRVTEITGNGPLLCNEAFGWAAALPELRKIRIDHNIPGPGAAVSVELYDGSGMAALAGSKLEEIKIGHAFDDDGMAALATVKSLRIVQIGHSRATDAGVARLANHPGIEEFSISSQARPNRVTDKCLPALATLPKLRRLGLHETFLTYENGLKHLRPLQGRLETVSFKASLVLVADVEKLKADHPGLVVETSAPAEILAGINSRGVERWASPEAVEYLKSGQPR